MGTPETLNAGLTRGGAARQDKPGGDNARLKNRLFWGRTLTRRMLVWAMAAMVAVWAGAVFVSFKQSVIESDELIDGQLASTAAVLLNLKTVDVVDAAQLTKRSAVPRHHQITKPPVFFRSRDAQPARPIHDEYQQTLSASVWDAAGNRLAHLGQAPMPEFSTPEGFGTIQVGTPPAPWRSFTQWDTARSRKVTVLVDIIELDDQAAVMASEVIGPSLWLLPVVAVLLGYAIWRGLRPLYELSDAVAALDVGRAERLPQQHALLEFESVVASINGLIGNQAEALERERRLASEIAHELRTPLSSIALQSEALRSPLNDADRTLALRQIEQDALRAGRVLNQLLSLARASRSERDAWAQDIEVGALARQVVSDCAQTAFTTQHELGLQVTGEFRLRAHPVLVELALRNLVDNALQHTPPGTSVEVQVGGDKTHVWLRVSDDGQDRGLDGARVPQPTHSERLGLGHTIVRRVADIHNGRFERSAAVSVNGAPAFTTSYTLTLPRVPSTART
jgi:two-component system, OmpR family, sensor histidine kinase QseC